MTMTMMDTAALPASTSHANTASLPNRSARITIPPSNVLAMPPISTASRIMNQQGLATSSPVNQNGSFEFDRVIKAGYVQRRTQKTKKWKTVYLVLRPNALSIYKSDKESKLRHKVYLSELSAVTLLKDPKQKRHNLFGLFSPAKNYHFEAPSANDALEWIDRIRKDARIEEVEEEMFLASPIVRRQSYNAVGLLENSNTSGILEDATVDNDRLGASSPEPIDIPPRPRGGYNRARRPSHTLESSGMSGNELVSQSDFSDSEVPRLGTSFEDLAVQSPSTSNVQLRPIMGGRNLSQMSGLNIENDPDRVVWQGWLQFLKSKRGVRQWKNCWAVLRPRNLILYKDESEYTAAFILPLSTVVNVVEIDPMNKHKMHCMQIITDEKSYRFCAPSEEKLVYCLGAFKSLLSKRKELEARRIAPSSGNAASAG